MENTISNICRAHYCENMRKLRNGVLKIARKSTAFLYPNKDLKAVINNTSMPKLSHRNIMCVHMQTSASLL
jgi:hypothetical protein